MRLMCSLNACGPFHALVLDEWSTEIHRTLDLDPFNPFFQCFYGWQLIYVQRYDEAIAQLSKVLATQPDFSSAHMGLWGAYYKKGMHDEALAEAIKFFVVLHDGEAADALTHGYTEGGYARAMRRGAEVLAERSKRTHVPAVRIARLYAHAGDKDEVLRWLNKAYDERENSPIPSRRSLGLGLCALRPTFPGFAASRRLASVTTYSRPGKRVDLDIPIAVTGEF